jgi:hypothetical protein
MSFFKTNFTFPSFPNSVYIALLSIEFESEHSIKTNSLAEETKGVTING